MKRFPLLLLALALFAAGCLRDAPTAVPVEGPPVEGPVFIKGSDQEVAEFVILLDDVTGRLLPSLSDQGIAAPLTAHLRDLAAAMTARDSGAARAALTDAMGLLDAYEAEHGWGAPDAADLVGVSLNLSTADALIGSDD